jgi:ribonuclease HI
VPSDPGVLTAHCDGAARGNPGPAGYGAVLTDESGQILAEIAEGIGVATNNVAEYRAAIAALERARDLGARRLLLRSDSRLLIQQLKGEWRVKNPTLIRLHTEARALAGSFDAVAYEHVRREFNKDADRLANRGVDEWLASNAYEARAPDPDLFG